MYRFTIGTAAIILLGIWSPIVRGDILLTVGNGLGVGGAVAAQNNRVEFDIVATRTGASFALGGFSLFFDVIKEGSSYSFGLPAGLDQGGVTFTGVHRDFSVNNVDFGLATDFRNSNPDFDFSINSATGPIAGNPMTNSLSLFRLQLDTTNLLSGTYSVIFRPEPALLVGDDAGPIGIPPFRPGDTGGEVGNITTASASFTVTSTAVPEPTSLALVGGVALFAAGVRRFRKKQKGN